MVKSMDANMFWSGGNGDWNSGNSWTVFRAPDKNDFPAIDVGNITITMPSMPSPYQVGGLTVTSPDGIDQNMIMLNNSFIIGFNLSLSNTKFLVVGGSQLIAQFINLDRNTNFTVVNTAMNVTSNWYADNSSLITFQRSSINYDGTMQNRDSAMRIMQSNFTFINQDGQFSNENCSIFFIGSNITSNHSFDFNNSKLALSAYTVAEFNNSLSFLNSKMTQSQTNLSFTESLNVNFKLSDFVSMKASNITFHNLTLPIVVDGSKFTIHQSYVYSNSTTISLQDAPQFLLQAYSKLYMNGGGFEMVGESNLTLREHGIIQLNDGAKVRSFGNSKCIVQDYTNLSVDETSKMVFYQSSTLRIEEHSEVDLLGTLSIFDQSSLAVEQFCKLNVYGSLDITGNSTGLICLSNLFIGPNGQVNSAQGTTLVTNNNTIAINGGSFNLRYIYQDISSNFTISNGQMINEFESLLDHSNISLIDNSTLTISGKIYHLSTILQSDRSNHTILPDTNCTSFASKFHYLNGSKFENNGHFISHGDNFTFGDSDISFVNNGLMELTNANFENGTIYNNGMMTIQSNIKSKGTSLILHGIMNMLYSNENNHILPKLNLNYLSVNGQAEINVIIPDNVERPTKNYRHIIVQYGNTNDISAINQFANNFVRVNGVQDCEKVIDVQDGSIGIEFTNCIGDPSQSSALNGSKIAGIVIGGFVLCVACICAFIYRKSISEFIRFHNYKYSTTESTVPDSPRIN